MKTICSTLMAMALLTPLAATAADELVDGASASPGRGLDVDFRSSAGLGRSLDVTSAPSVGLSAPMEVDERGFDTAGTRTLSPFDGQLADALPRPLPPASAIDLFADQVRGMGIEAIDWLAPRVRYPSTLPELIDDESGQATRQLLDLLQPPFGLTFVPLRAAGRLSLVDVDPVFGLPRYARAWKLGDRGTLYAGVSAVDDLRGLYARAAAELSASPAPTALDNARLAGLPGLVARGPNLTVAIAPLDDVYAVVAVIEGAGASDPAFVSGVFRSLNRTPGLDDDAAIAEALVPGAGVHFQYETGPLEAPVAWHATTWPLSESALQTTVRDTYGLDVTLLPLTGVPTPMAVALAASGTSYALVATDAQNTPTLLGQLNVATTTDRPERVAALLARDLSASPAVAQVDGRYLLTGLYEDTSNVGRPTYAFRATLTPLADGTTFVTRSFLRPTVPAAAVLHGDPAFDLALPGLAGQTATPTDGPTLPAMSLAVRRATRPPQLLAMGVAGPLRFEPTEGMAQGVGAAALGYGTGGLVLTYEPLLVRGYLLTGAQFGRIVNPEGNDEDGGFDLFAHGRYELPMQFLPDLTTEVSAGLHFGLAGNSAFGIGLRAAAHYRLAGPLTAWVALQSQHYPNPEVNGTWLALSIGLGYRPQ